MRIIILSNSDIGLYNFRLELIERLLADGHQVVISSPYGERIEPLKALGCSFCETEMSRHGTNPFKELKLIKEYKRLLAKEKPDVVFSYTIKPNIYGALACKVFGIPCVANITGLGTAVENDGLLQKITVFLYRRALKSAQRVFFQNSENMRFFADRKIAPGKHALLPGSGVNLRRFVPLEYPSDTTIGFVFLSRIMKEKGIDQYLEAAEYIHKKYPATVFHVCGFCEQAYEEKLLSLQSQHVIVYHGMVSDVRTVLKDIHCTVHPTYYPEGMSNVLLESAACARPVITTDRAGCREVIDDGVNGFICRQKDGRDLIRQIEKFLTLSHEQRKEMGFAGRRKVEKEFDRQLVVDAYMRELQDVEREKC